MRARSRPLASRLHGIRLRPERQARNPVKLAFSLAFALDPASPNHALRGMPASFPGKFLEPAFQIHAMA